MEVKSRREQETEDMIIKEKNGVLVIQTDFFFIPAWITRVAFKWAAA